MSFKTAWLFSALVIVLATASWVWLHFNIPDHLIATHFGPGGVANGFMPRDKAFAFGPIIIVVVTLILGFLPRIMPKNSRLERSEAAYSAIWMATIAFLACTHGLIVALAMGRHINPTVVVGLGLGALFAVMGNVLPKMRYNYVAGIRTPWTLSDERVWDKTHRLAGLLFFISGVAIAGCSLVLPARDVTVAYVILALIPSVICVIYSYAVSRRLDQS